ncbi:hypothetical protein EAH69_05435 [Faecalibacter macacae]|uniref:Uncharacterized protein n=1 Tax=Faecalibacter macacae TaxID=1859289 RepID=A0A3L9MF30_9FLAO|nr:hypothetical protein EAH69_05435 [Faecalibacter macacae]
MNQSNKNIFIQIFKSSLIFYLIISTILFCLKYLDILARNNYIVNLIGIIIISVIFIIIVIENKILRTIKYNNQIYIFQLLLFSISTPLIILQLIIDKWLNNENINKISMTWAVISIFCYLILFFSLKSSKRKDSNQLY